MILTSNKTTYSVLILEVSVISCYRPDGYAGRGSPKADLEASHDSVEEKVSARASASSPIGGHVADIYLANLNK